VADQEVDGMATGKRGGRHQHHTLACMVDTQTQPARADAAAEFDGDRQREGRLEQFGRAATAWFAKAAAEKNGRLRRPGPTGRP
jgi:hypothetical protein